jgi:hypothetical protein
MLFPFSKFEGFINTITKCGFKNNRGTIDVNKISTNDLYRIMVE